MSKFPNVPSGDGVTGQILADRPDLKMVQFSFEGERGSSTLVNPPL